MEVSTSTEDYRSASVYSLSAISVTNIQLTIIRRSTSNTSKCPRPRNSRILRLPRIIPRHIAPQPCSVIGGSAIFHPRLGGYCLTPCLPDAVNVVHKAANFAAGVFVVDYQTAVGYCPALFSIDLYSCVVNYQLLGKPLVDLTVDG